MLRCFTYNPLLPSLAQSGTRRWRPLMSAFELNAELHPHGSKMTSREKIPIYGKKTAPRGPGERLKGFDPPLPYMLVQRFGDPAGIEIFWLKAMCLLISKRNYFERNLAMSSAIPYSSVAS